MGKFPYKTWLLAAFLLLTPWAAQAAGLGKLTILSALGQPLRAEIDLVSVTKDELSSLTVRLASPEAFRQSNIEYSEALIGLRLSVERRADNQPYIKISSTRTINEPFLDLLIELNWDQGHLLREYTALIDPTDYNPAPVAQMPAAAPPPVAEAPVTPITPASPVAPAAPETSSPAAGMPMQPAATEPPPSAATTETPPPAAAVPAPPATQEAAAPQPPAAVPAVQPEAAKEYQVKHGDTLSKIANEYKTDGMTTEQILVVLFRSNPDAFAGNNMNRLKTGKILRLPTAEEVAALPAPEAKKEVRVQATHWNAYRRKLAEMAGETPSQESPAITTGKISAVEAHAPGEAAPGKDVLKLSKGEDVDGKTSPDARVRSLQEDAIAREKALAEANDRIAVLEKNINDMHHLLELKGQVPPAMPPAASPAAAPATSVTPLAAPVAALPAKTESPAATTTMPPPAATVASPAPDAMPKQKPKTAVPTTPPPAPEVGLLDEILDDPLYLGAIGGVAVLLGGAAFLFIRRRQGGDDAKPEKVSPKKKAKTKDPVEAVDPLSQTVTLPAPPVMAAAGGDDVDPIAEADLYLNFGRDAQAEEVLKEALDKTPQNEQVRLKLLQIYAGRKDKATFEKVARVLHDQTAGAGENWLKAAAMGYALDAANTLYAAGKSATAGPAAAAVVPPALGGGVDLDFDFDLASSGAVPTATQVELEAANAAAAQKTTVFRPGELTQEFKPDEVTDITGDSAKIRAAVAAPDFTLNVPGPATESEPDITLTPGENVAKTDLAVGDIAAGGNMIDFSLDSPGETASKNAESSQTLAPDFKLDLDSDASTKLPDLNLDDIKLDFEAPPKAEPAANAKDDRWFDVQTKFDLAKAYQEMGDKDGAREILEEVIKEGDPAQQGEAKILLESL